MLKPYPITWTSQRSDEGGFTRIVRYEIWWLRFWRGVLRGWQ
jgi:hypothetical protein